MANLEEVYGPCAPSDYQPGAKLRFLRDGRECYGELLHVRRPGPAVQGGAHHPVLYIVDTGEGWPVAVPAGNILYQKEEP